MFSKANLNRVWWPVVLTVYGPDGDEREVPIRLLFEPLTRRELRERNAQEMTSVAELKKRMREVREAAKASDASAAEVDDEIDSLLDSYQQRADRYDQNIAEVATRTHDWRAVTDDAGAAIPFDREHLRALLEHNWFANPVFRAFEACSSGAARKNSQPGPAGAPGPAQS